MFYLSSNLDLNAKTCFYRHLSLYLSVAYESMLHRSAAKSAQ